MCLPKQFRRAVALGLLSLSTSGCASLSPSKWSSTDAYGGTTEKPKSGFSQTLSSTTKGISGQFKSMGTAVSSAYSKTKSAVTSTFTVSKNGEENDPTSLANMPDKSTLGPEIWVTNGQLYESQGNFGKALDNYTKALEQEPNNQAALLSTARLYARQQQHAQAAEFFQKSLALSPQAAIYNELAISLQGQGQSAEAQAAVRKAIEMEPANPRYRNNLAGMLVKGGRSDEAVNELLQVFPPAVANYNVAYLHVQNQNVAAAQQHLQTALKLDPNLALARDLMNQISNSSVAQSAVAAYQTAGDIYRTAEGVANPNVQANAAVYQLPGQAGGMLPASGISSPTTNSFTAPSDAASRPAVSSLPPPTR